MKTPKLTMLMVFVMATIFAVLHLGPSGPGTSGTFSGYSVSSANRAQSNAVPQKAIDTLRYVQKNGGPPPGYIGGRVFQNREGRLPNGRYREYDVDPKEAGAGRDADRIIIDDAAGRAWYTGDHYTTFVEFR